MKEDANEMKSNGTLTKEPSESGAHYNIFDANYGAWLTSIGQERAILTDEDIADYRNKMNPCLYVADSLEELAEAIGVVLLAIGGAGGWFARKLMEAAKRGARMPETDAARDIERVRAERQAFEALMGYNAETAYGMQKEG